MFLRWIRSGAGLFELSFTPQHAAAYEAVAGCLAEGGATSRVQVGLLDDEACMHMLHDWPSVHCPRLVWQGIFSSVPVALETGEVCEQPGQGSCVQFG